MLFRVFLTIILYGRHKKSKCGSKCNENKSVCRFPVCDRKVLARVPACAFGARVSAPAGMDYSKWVGKEKVKGMCHNNINNLTLGTCSKK